MPIRKPSQAAEPIPVRIVATYRSISPKGEVEERREEKTAEWKNPVSTADANIGFIEKGDYSGLPEPVFDRKVSELFPKVLTSYDELDKPWSLKTEPLFDGNAEYLFYAVCSAAGGWNVNPGWRASTGFRNPSSACLT